MLHAKQSVSPSHSGDHSKGSKNNSYAVLFFYIERNFRRFGSGSPKGIKVTVIADKSQRTASYTQVRELVHQGIDVLFDTKPAIAITKSSLLMRQPF